jgi:tetratricopeptide (TPR) repeat protein
MPDPIDALVQQWKHDPSAQATVALCEALRDSPRRPLIQQVGEFAAQRHASDVTVLVSVARMYVQSQRLAEAQAVLLAAGKQAPRDPRVYRWLGEVLLRRGDAARASKVFERALQFGPREPEAQLWLERARTYEPMQKSAGEASVAADVAQVTGNGRRTQALKSETPTTVAVAPSIKPSVRGATPTARAPRAPAPRKAPPQAPAPQRAAPPVASERPLHEPTAPANKVAARPAPVSTGPSIPERLRDGLAVDKGKANGFVRPAPLASKGPAVPYPRDVLDALMLSGVFEPQKSGAGAGWDRPLASPKRKGTATLVTAMGLFLAASVGTYFLYRHKRAAEHLQAEAILATVEDKLHGGRPDALGDAEKELAQALQLESRNPRAALDWTRERALVGLVKSGGDVAFEDAMARAKEVGVPEEKFAFARVASFLLQGDTAGAAGMMPRWDGPAAADAWYQLVTGATLERAGDARASGRYAASAKLDPELVVAEIGAARATALDGDAQSAMRMAAALRAKLPDRAEPVALVALAWGRDPGRDPSAAPPEVLEVSKRAAELPAALQFVPHAIAALQALDRHAPDEARAEVEKGLGLSQSPGAAVWLGTIALPLDDEPLARKAALSALQLSAIYEPARALAARVALHAGRLDEALKATEELDETSTDVAIVRAASAYERADADGVARALSPLRTEDRRLPVVSALTRSQGALSGSLRLDGPKLLAMADDDAPWSDLVAMDLALDEGDLATADRIALGWGKEAEGAPARALRLARLSRYEGRLDAADALSQVALDHGTVTPRVLWERTFELVVRGHAADVGPLLSRYPLVLGPLATWLGAYAAASAGATESAKGKTATLDPPPEEAVFGARVVAAAAFGAMKDRKRGTSYVRDLVLAGSLHPDLVAAALSLGMRRVDHGKRHPTYE